MRRSRIEEAINALKLGKPIMIHDFESRENEIDLVYYAKHVGVNEVYTLRTLAGGLICFVIDWDIARKLKLPFFYELLQKSELSKLIKIPKYGELPAFSLWINHIEVRTGISDYDKALTIRKFFEVVKLAYQGDTELAYKKFLEEFMAPGHVPVLISRGIEKRHGHTELSIALAKLGHLIPAMVIAEMLDKGSSMKLEKARTIARENGIVLLTGNEIIKAQRRLKFA